MSYATSGTQTIILGHTSAITAPGRSGTCAIGFTDVAFSYSGTTSSRVLIRSIILNGVSGGARQVEVTLHNVGLGLRLTSIILTATDGTGGFSVSFDVSSHMLPLGHAIDLNARVTDPSTCVASIANRVILGSPLGVHHFAEGIRSRLHSGKSDFVAGHPDRILERKIYASLVHSFGVHTRVDAGRIRKMAQRVGSSLEQVQGWAEEFSTAMKSQIGQLIKKKNTLTTDLFKALNAADSAARKKFPLGILVLKNDVKKVVKGKQLWAEAANAMKFVKLPDANFEFASHPIGNGLTIMTAVSQRGEDPNERSKLNKLMEDGAFGLLSQSGGKQTAVAGGLYNFINLGWLGVMHYDRLRFRASGLTVGEHVFSHALSPGEEVSLSQRSETKRTELFERVADTSEEQQLEFSSTWSTDLTQGISDSSSKSTSKGGGLQGSGSYKGFGGSIGAQYSSSDTDTRTRNVQKSRSRSETERAASTMRMQHKTTFKVSTDITEEFGSRRTLRNTNPLRAATFHFFKVYEKQQMVLERYDARLCVCRFIEDPFKKLREEMIEELVKLDPIVQGSAFLGNVTGEVRQNVIINNNNHSSGTEYGEAIINFQIPAGMIMSSFDFRVTEWNTIEYSELPGIIYNPQPGTRAPESYNTEGGQISFPYGNPPIGTGGNVQITVKARMPEASGLGWYTVSIKGVATCKYTKPEAFTGDIAAAREEIKRSFSVERVNAILDEIESGARDSLCKEFADQVYFPGFGSMGLDVPIGPLDAIKNYFQWEDMQAEFFPYWMSTEGIACREDMRRRLLALPGDYNSSRILMSNLFASHAKVYVPIHLGQERSVLEVLTGADLGNLDQLLEDAVVDFETYRTTNFPTAPRSLSTSNEIMAPSSNPATPADSSSWNNEWEKHDANFIVVDQWAELVPTDGVHIEIRLSDSTVADEARAQALGSDLAIADAMQELRHSQAAAANSISNKSNLSTIIKIGDA